VHIQQVKLEMDEGGMGDHGDLPMCQKFLQLRRLQNRTSHGAAGCSDRGDHEADVGVSRTASEERLSRKSKASSSRSSNSSSRMEQMESSKDLIWDPGGFPTA
jgi:hypothetical protein